MSKAVQFDSYGGVDVLEVRDVPRPVPGTGEVLVKVKAAGINPSEAVIRSGALHHMFPATFRSGQGSDFAGIVAELGPGVSGVAVGNEVIGFSMRRSSHAAIFVTLRVLTEQRSREVRFGPRSHSTDMRCLFSISCWQQSAWRRWDF